MKKFSVKFSYILGFLALLLAGCAPEQTTVTPTLPDPLRPFFTPTSSLPAGQTATPTPEVILPTPTPITYVIQKGDTFGSIAQAYGVMLDDLVEANPQVVPEALTVGATIIIPNAPSSTAVPAPVIAPVTVSELSCWPTQDGGLWCFLPVLNSTDDVVENLSAQVVLAGADNMALTSQSAFAPLDLLPPGKATALYTFFPAPLPDGFTPQAELTSAIRILPSDARYQPVALRNVLTQIDWSGASARVSGSVAMAGESQPVEVPSGRVWVSAVAYDALGNVVGVKRWESEIPLAANVLLPFDFMVSSVGPAIERVDVQAQARP